LNFYALHTAILPIVLLLAVPFHFWRIRMAHGIVVRRAPGEQLPTPLPMVRTVPHLVTREVAAGLLVLAAILAVSIALDAPLTEQANPGMSPNPTKAPWFFMGIQEILMHFHPVFAALVIPACLLAALLAVPYIRYDAPATGVWFQSVRGRQTALLAAAGGFVLTGGAVLLSEWVLPADNPAPLTLVRNGLVPFLAVLTVAGGFYLLVRKGLGANRSESVQALFTLLLTSFLTLTLIGIAFRGAGMQLVWAW
jgi:quinol-cytochrome oxidoreductase complex cytochrome b subunit